MTCGGLNQNELKTKAYKLTSKNINNMTFFLYILHSTGFLPFAFQLHYTCNVHYSFLLKKKERYSEQQ